MAETKIARCAHPGCNCSIAKGSKYCSDYCESSGSRVSISCNCGHSECATGEAAGAAQ